MVIDFYCYTNHSLSKFASNEVAVDITVGEMKFNNITLNFTIVAVNLLLAESMFGWDYQQNSKSGVILIIYCQNSKLFTVGTVKLA